MDRREFLANGVAFGAAVGLPTIVPGGVLGETAPSKRITLGCIGVGRHGAGYNLRSFLQLPDAQVAAVCDVFRSRRERARTIVDAKYGGVGCEAHADFRDVLTRQDIDAVVISTPDHWHVPLSILAAHAGKDVFCEKPTLTIAEGRLLVDVVKRRARVYQGGIEDRSVGIYHRMAELVRNGYIGKLRRIVVTLPGGRDRPVEAPVAVPDDLNYDMWLGPAPEAPYTPSRTAASYWRCIRDYSGGQLADWGAHLIDTAQVANFAERSGPVAVCGVGQFPENSLCNTPVTYKLNYRYANGVEMVVSSGGTAIRFEGADGWIGNAGWRKPLEASSPEILRVAIEPRANKMWPQPLGEHRNFLDCVKTRKPAYYCPEEIHRLSSVMHIGNIAMLLGRKLRWDPEAESFPDDGTANRLRSRAMREPWSLETMGR